MKPPPEGAISQDQEFDMACNHGDVNTANQKDKESEKMDESNVHQSQHDATMTSDTDNQDRLETPNEHLETPEDVIDGDDDVIDGDDDDMMDDTDASSLTLLMLPPEVLWCIIEFLDTRFVITQMSAVCKHLYELLNYDMTWKARISKRWPNRYPINQVDSENFNWKLACIQREEQYRLWSDHKNTMESFCLNNGHIGPVDSVHLMQEGTICISGSRDRSIQIWDLTKLDAADPKKSVKASRGKSVIAHTGWVWHVTSHDSTVVTSSWDCWLKMWDMNSDCTEINKFKGKTAFLSTVILPNHTLISGAFDQLIYIHDPRADKPLVDKLHHHTKPVLSVEADDQYIISGSEDNSIAIYDRRAHKIFKKIELNSFPMCMSYGFNQLWTGQKDGTLHILDPTYGNFDIVETYDSGHKGKLTDVIHNLGSVITCSTDKTIKVHEPNHNPAVITTHSDFVCDIASLHMQNHVLASACSNGEIGIWRPIAS